MANIKDIISSFGSATKYEKDTNCCAVIALTASFEIPYDTAHEVAFQQWGRVDRRGVPSARIFSSFNSGSFLGRCIEKVQTMREYWAPGGSRMRKMKVKSFAQLYNRGTYYIIIRSHALVVKDGVIIDNRRDAANRNVVKAWKVLPSRVN
jgi:hypothetical protein